MITQAELRAIALFDGLSGEQLDEILDGADEVGIVPGETLWLEGGHADFWWVLVDGAIDLVRRIGREDVVVGRMDVPGRWAGGFRAWDDNGVYLATARGAAPGRLLRVRAARLHELAHRWFPFAAHLVAGLYGTARSIEATARQRGALVTLGTLAAGLAHEINNPASAATRSAAELEAACTEVIGSLQRMAHGELTAQQFTALDGLRMQLSAPGAAVDALELADREEELGEWLDARGVSRPWDLASSLAAAGADPAWCEKVAAVVPDAALPAAVSWVGSTAEVAALLAEVKESTRRVSELVAAIKSYSQMDRPSFQRLDVRDGIESTLLVLGPRLRTGVTVVRDWGEDVPPIEGMPGELNQVWTNLIDNAVDAMDGAGTLTITTRRDGDGAVVEVRDTGSGLSAEARERAFEPFYTTKGVGKGTGLGLDIARRIVVERHGGRIEVDSEPGDTRFRVRLPARPAKSP